MLKAEPQVSNLPLVVEVVNSDLCIACGACVHACPQNNIRSAYVAELGAYGVHVISEGACDGCGKPCETVCPSIAMDYRKAARFRFGRECTSNREGVVEKVLLGVAAEYVDNGVSSSGGVVRALIADTLRSGSPVVCLARNGDSYAPETLQSESEMSRVPGSIYHSVSFAELIPLLRSLDEPAVLIATPCQLEGLFNFAREIDSAIESKIRYTVGLICGWMYSDHSLSAFAKFKGIQEPIVDAQYRGENQVGFLKLTSGRQVHRFDRREFKGLADAIDYRAAFSSAANRLRCRVCQNHVNVLADVAVGDAWLSRSPGVKRSIVIVRSAMASKVISRMMGQGRLSMEGGSWSDVIESQSANLVYGQTAQCIVSEMEIRNQFAPSFHFDEQSEKPVACRTGWASRSELLMRYLLRTRRYTMYRGLYFVLHSKGMARIWLSMLRKRWRQSNKP